MQWKASFYIISEWNGIATSSWCPPTYEQWRNCRCRLGYQLHKQSLSIMWSSGCLLIVLSVSRLLSCTIHRPTKRWYSRLWTMSTLSLYFTCLESFSSIKAVPVHHLDFKSELSNQSGLLNQNPPELQVICLPSLSPLCLPVCTSPNLPWVTLSTPICIPYWAMVLALLNTCTSSG